MRRFHCPDLPESGETWLDGDEGRHLAKVLRARPGDRVALMDGRGTARAAEVVRVERGRVLLMVGELLPVTAARRDVTLLTAVPRGARMEWLIEKSVEAGVARIVPLVTERGVRDAAGENVVRRWSRAALEAAKQCGRVDVPPIAPLQSLETALTALGSTRLLAATPGAEATIEQQVGALGAAEVVALAIGPEGGFDDAESARLDAAGAARFGLGELILRVETAAVIAVHRAAWCPFFAS